ncbi:MAG: hypothetical protein ACRDQ4_25775 [Pseudonocardiaceae bacterium]
MNGDGFSERFGSGALVERVIEGLLREGELGGAPCYAPDGLAGKALEELIEGAYAEVAGGLRLTSGLLDGSAAEQRRRRVARRGLGVMVHVLPVGRVVCGSDEWRAA